MTTTKKATKAGRSAAAVDGPSLTVGVKALGKMLGVLGTVVDAKPAIPILDSVRIVAEHGVLTLTTADMNYQLTTSIELAAENMAVCVSYEVLSKLVSSLADQPLTITVNPDTFDVGIKSSSGNAKLTGYNPEDFPRIEHRKAGSHGEPIRLTLDASERLAFVHYLSKLLPVVTKPDKGTPATENICWSGGTLVATDGFRLVSVEGVPEACPPRLSVQDHTGNRGWSGHDFLLPPVGVKGLIELSTAEDQTLGMDITLTRDRMSATIGNSSASMRLRDEIFPDWRFLSRPASTTTWSVERMTAISTLKRLLICSEKKGVTANLIRLSTEMNGNEEQGEEAEGIQMRSDDPLYGQEAEELLPADIEGKSLTIGVSGKFLVDAFSACEGERVSMAMTGPKQWLWIEGEDQSLTIALGSMLIPGN